MKKQLLTLGALLFIACGVFAQENTKEEFKPSGKAYGLVFFNYHQDLTDGSAQRNAFEVQRAYLGYQYNLSEKISAKITLDGASKASEASDYTVFLKNAQLDWKLSNTVSLTMGMMGTQQWNTQEKFFNYRYLYKNFQDEFGLGSSADLGVNAKVNILSNLEANFFMLNGEGYTSVQDDYGRMKFGTSVVYKPVKGLILKGYYDIYGGDVEIDNDSVVYVRDTASIHTIAFFGGYQTEKFRVGLEYDIQLNGTKYNKQAEDHDTKGLALYGAYTLNDKIEFFAQWFNFKSNKVDGADQTWNYSKDGDVLLAGVQYKPLKGLRFAFNYRTILYDNPAKTDASYVSANCEISF